jgi:hypothetical protein
MMRSKKKRRKRVRSQTVSLLKMISFKNHKDRLILLLRLFNRFQLLLFTKKKERL